MRTPPATKQCEMCGGRGVTPRTQRQRVDGSLDPLDIVGQHPEICMGCGGAGEVLATKRPVVERKGPAADFWA